MMVIPREFPRFCAVGAIGFVVDAGVLHILTRQFGLDPYSGRFISFLLAATVTWQLNRHYTFSAAGESRLCRQWGRYVAANAMGGGLNYLTYSAGVMLFDIVQQHLLLGVAVGSAIGLLVNYTASRHLVFKRAAAGW